MDREIGTIGYLLSYTKIKIIEINFKRGPTSSERSENRTVKPYLVEYLEDSRSTKKGTQIWVHKNSISGIRRRGWKGKKS